MEFSKDSKDVTVLASITSGIGTALAEKYSKKGDIIIGTYRNKDSLDKLEKIPNCHLFYCDINDKKSMNNFIEKYREMNLKWDNFISCVGDPRPLKSFCGGDFDSWNESVHTNVIEQLRMTHGLYPLRNKDKVSNIVYFAGGGSNNAVINLSAYAASRIMLTKMCELLDAENKDINPFIIGPGITKTKFHDPILKNLDRNDQRYIDTKKFMENNEGTSMEDIFNCIDWLCQQGKDVAGGRNFSVVHDKWGNEKLADLLKSDKNMYKLRRSGGDCVI